MVSKVNKMNLLASASLLAIGAFPAIGTATAQEDDAAERRLEPVIVSATRRDETVQDIALNIAAVDSGQIEEQGLTELGDLLAFVPGINVVDGGGRQGNPIIVRGINAAPLGSNDGNNNGGGTVATYLGDIPVFVDLKLNDLQRVEVLLGPQGTLYGSGTLGGAIRYIPNAPDFDADLLKVRAEVFHVGQSESASTDVGFTVNKAITDNFAIRGSFDYVNDSGFIDQPFRVREIGVSDPDPDFSDPAAVAANLIDVEDTNGEEVFSGRVAARWQPTSWLDGTLTYYYQESDIEGRSASSFRSVLPTREFANNLRVPEPNMVRNQLLALEVTADLGFAELTSASGFSKFEDEGQRDQTDLLITLQYSYEAFPTFTAFTREVGEEERFNQELRLVSTHGGPISWIVGGFWNDLDAVGSSSEFTPGFSDFAGFNRPDDLEFFSQGRSSTLERAIFGEITYTLFDRLALTFGGRYYDYEIEAFSASDLPFFDPDFVAPSISEIEQTAFDPDLAQSDDGFLFKVNVAYDVTDDVLVYGTISEGFRVGGVNGVAACPAVDPTATDVQMLCALTDGQQFLNNGVVDISPRDETQFGPDTTRNYELGTKTTLLDGSLQLNAAAFYVEWNDPQLASATSNGSLPITVNADGAESVGVELSGNWQATDRLNLRGSFSYAKAELTAPVPSLITTIAPPGFDRAFEDGESGDRLPGSPETQFSIFGSYVLPIDHKNDLVLNAGYAWQGDVLTRAGSRGGGFVLDDFGLANMSLNYIADDWSVGLYVDNLFNEFAETGARSTPLTNQVVTDSAGGNVNTRAFFTTVAQPRVIGLRMAYQFGG